ncbi:NAD(P)H-binding protein [Actinoplanes sp. NPDC026619]|uniref:NAD(P)H-binding protein n=1 Tax=Actinoplanes sp. NPDC026619 TaxID=3155798 RepID=UPI0033CB7BF1
MRILVLGATGNVGRAIVEAALAGGDEARAVSRSGKRLPPGAEARVGDLDDAATLAGVPAMFTLAGCAGLTETPADARRRGVERVSANLEQFAR